MITLSRFDWVLVGAIALLHGIGILALYGISPDGESGGFVARQLVFTGLGLPIFALIASLDYRHMQKYGTMAYFGTLALLILVLFFGKTVNGTEGWMSFGAFRFQPVELSKLALILFLASFIAKKRTELGELVRLIASVFFTLAMIVLVLKQPDLGSALVLVGVWMGMTLIAGMRLRYFTAFLLGGLCVVFSGWTMLAPYQKDRVVTVMNPDLDPSGSGYHVIQSTLAVGSGGMFGKGIGHGSQSQLNFLPEKHTDFIFSVIAEELGAVGALSVLFLYGVILYRLSRIALFARDNFGYLTVVGIMALLFIQITVNIGMNIGLLPVTGIPLPLLSYGGSSLVTVFAALGMAMSIFIRKKNEMGFVVSLDRSHL